ncbi:MAG: hypothetical protein R3B95_10810 [Nitrospirales bacterium]|nr:hypothetical protein [Nitrospirales bacterium]
MQSRNLLSAPIIYPTACPSAVILTDLTPGTFDTNIMLLRRSALFFLDVVSIVLILPWHQGLLYDDLLWNRTSAVRAISLDLPM